MLTKQIFGSRHPSQYSNNSWTSVYWPLHTPFKKEYLEIKSGNMSVGYGLRARKCAFWKHYLPSLLGKLKIFKFLFSISKLSSVTRFYTTGKKEFCHYFKIYLLLGNKLDLLFHMFNAIGQIFIVAKGQILKNVVLFNLSNL